MSKIDFLFGLHFDQPLGEKESVLEDAYQSCYLPFFQLMKKHPKIKFSFHFSGVLYDWFLKDHPEFIGLLKGFVQRRQAEVLSGPHYNPILLLIPDHDKIGQIKLQNDFIKKHLGVTPRGLWLCAEAFEQHLVKILHQAQIEYLPISDSLFEGEFEKNGSFITEEEGITTRLFLICETLKKISPSHPVDEIFSYFKRVLANKNKATITLFDEGEKYRGIQWLEELLRRLEANQTLVRTTTFSDYLEDVSFSTKVYPKASNIRSQLVQSSDLDYLHKKMLHVSLKLESSKKSNNKKLEEAKVELYRGQSYLGNRSSLYKSLIRSENIIDNIRHESKYSTEVAITDFNKDGADEVLMSNDQLSAYFVPNKGGAIFEIDYKPKSVNILGQFSLNDHFFDKSVSAAHLQSKDYHECGDFLNATYSFFPQRKKEEVSVSLSRSGQVIDKDGVIVPIKVLKKISLLKGQSILNIDYEITSLFDQETEILFGPDFHLFPSQDNSCDVSYNVDQVKLVDDDSGFNVSLVFEKKSMLVRFPNENSVLIPIWTIRLLPKSHWTNRISLRLEG